MPLHMPHDMHLRRKTSTFYGGKSKRAAVQHHCFATDSDGFYSCYRIDEEVSLSTHGMVRYVVPENSAPNWRASIALVSAMDCSFYWKTTHPATILDNWKFVDGKKKSRCTVISAKADFRMKNEMFRLESHVEGVHLLIFVEDAANAMNPKSLPSNIVDLVYESERWEQKVNEQIYLPKCTTSLPISLYDHSKHHGLNRLFSSEKSELGSMKTSKFDGSSAPNFVTLFDHYHKTVFDILPNPPNKTGLKKRQFDVLAPGKAHQCIEDSMAKLFGKFQDETSASTDPFFTYYEDHLHQNPGSLDYVDDKTAFDTGAPGINLAKPFYYVMMSRKFEDNFMIVCGGYFNNTIWANKA
ncbi:hypothetical protein L3Y34_016216 [Caenorhabditis briggsae]|uniref:Serpin domain-containing protein n=1 Tax=Caenorhabditis briggsae TaxID=6238 RepID=A0AAE9DX33_CAEBR|nr:hypothetical protein L3Y34_016216 [Caenorhabditis briggsae]